jgi:hypothetical protein
MNIYLFAEVSRIPHYLTGMNRTGLFLLLLFVSCQGIKKIKGPERFSSLTGSAFYKQAAGMNWKGRDSLALREILAGNIPSFLMKFVAVHISVSDSVSGQTINAVFYAAPDYLSVGTDDDWARINITPMAAQQIADSLNCFLPTRKMVDDIYKAARLKPEPVPMYAFRDSTPTMWQHHLIIEGQRKGKMGLIAGIKKDVVISSKIISDAQPNRVAIYGWHKPDGRPIQPLYTGHVNWYVDYSHGIRLVYRKIKVEGKWMDYTDILTDKGLQKLLCDEPVCDCVRYNY